MQSSSISRQNIKDNKYNKVVLAYWSRDRLVRLAKSLDIEVCQDDPKELILQWVIEKEAFRINSFMEFDDEDE